MEFGVESGVIFGRASYANAFFVAFFNICWYSQLNIIFDWDSNSWLFQLTSTCVSGWASYRTWENYQICKKLIKFDFTGATFVILELLCLYFFSLQPLCTIGILQNCKLIVEDKLVLSDALQTESLNVSWNFIIFVLKLQYFGFGGGNIVFGEWFTACIAQCAFAWTLSDIVILDKVCLVELNTTSLFYVLDREGQIWIEIHSQCLRAIKLLSWNGYIVVIEGYDWKVQRFDFTTVAEVVWVS